MENNYPKAYKEVVEILKYVPKESIDKIPQTMIDTFKAKMDNTYIFSIDIDKSFEEQKLFEKEILIFLKKKNLSKKKKILILIQ